MACTAQSNFECASINEKLLLILSFANDLSWFSEEENKALYELQVLPYGKRRN